MVGPSVASECGICLQTVTGIDSYLHCPTQLHRFHRKCIEKWLKVIPNCPTCREPVVPLSVQKKVKTEQHMRNRTHEAIEAAKEKMRRLGFKDSRDSDGNAILIANNLQIDFTGLVDGPQGSYLIPHDRFSVPDSFRPR